MKEPEDEKHTELEQDASSMPEKNDQPDAPSRRQLIERYGRYAIVAAPLLLFASKAHAIHSRP